MPLLLVLLLAAAPATDDPRGDANARLQAGNAAFEQGAIDAAIESYEAAYATFPSPKILYNLARAYEAAGRLSAACDTFERFVAEVDAGDRELRESLVDRVGVARESLDRLRVQLAHLALALTPADATLRIDGRRRERRAPPSAPWSFWLAPGEHDVVADKEGFATERRRLRLEADRPVELTLTLQPTAEPATVAIPVVATPARAPQPEARPSRALWWSLAAGTVIVATAATWWALRNPCTPEACY